jgi:transcriptional regulator with XRE-family HTH domain
MLADLTCAFVAAKIARTDDELKPHMTPAHKNSSQFAGNFGTYLLVQQLAAKEIGARIAQARNEAGGMTQPELADLLDLSLRQVQNIEAGTTIPYKYFRRLEEIFPDRPLGWFLHGDEATRPGAGEVDERLDGIEERLGRVEDLARDVLSEIQQLRDDQPATRRKGARS